ncbi:MAG: helix-turn-helix domain-containing protein [Peptococcaceae bacterium]|nr:helix-turn-helix domain-containing protein [Peptococcaceae bacterium]
MTLFQESLKRLRKEDGLTQEELAKKLNISRSAIGMYETGEREPDLESVETIADFFNVDMNELLGYKNSSTNEPPKEHSMRKPKIYLDTSAISHLEQPEKPSEQAYSRELFDYIKAGRYDVYLSSVVFDEIGDCSPERKEALLRHVAEISFEDIHINADVALLASKIIERNVLPKRSRRDSQHIAAAIIAGCDYIVSWNMRHMANVKTNKNIRHILIDEGYKEIMLVPPTMLLEGSVDHESDN